MIKALAIIAACEWGYILFHAYDAVIYCCLAPGGQCYP